MRTRVRKSESGPVLNVVVEKGFGLRFRKSECDLMWSPKKGRGRTSTVEHSEESEVLNTRLRMLCKEEYIQIYKTT